MNPNIEILNIVNNGLGEFSNDNFLICYCRLLLILFYDYLMFYRFIFRFVTCRMSIIIFDVDKICLVQ